MTSISHLQAAAQRNFGLDYPGALRQVHGIAKDPNGIAYELYGVPLYSALDNLLSDLGGRHLVLDGTSGTYLSSPDVAAFDIAGDLDFRFEGSTFSDGNRALIAKWGASGNRSYIMQLGAFNAFAFTTTDDGSTTFGNATANFLTTDRLNWAFRLTFDADDGSGNRVATYYSGARTPKSSSIDGATTVIETVTTAGATSIFNSTADLTIGAQNDGASNVAQLEIDRIELYDGIDGTLVANPDLRFLDPGTTSFQDSLGNTWTLNGNASIA